jgi:hypothetical protein
MGMGEATTTTENTPVGTLTVDVFDSQSKQLLWRGKSSETLSGKSDKNEKKLEKDVADMFKKFPPPTKRLVASVVRGRASAKIVFSNDTRPLHHI